MPFVQITMAEGRTEEQKRRLLREITAAFVRAGAAPESAVRAWVVEVPNTQIIAAGTILADKNLTTTNVMAEQQNNADKSDSIGV